MIFIRASSLILLFILSNLASVNLVMAETSAKKMVRIHGGAGSIAHVKSDRAEIEKLIGTELEIKPTTAEAAIAALKKGFIEGVAAGLPAKALLESTHKDGDKSEDATNYEEVQVGKEKILIGLNPENPVSQLTDQQVTDLVSGKLKTWQSINGRNDPVVVVMNKSFLSMAEIIPNHYLNQSQLPNALMVTDKQGQFNNLKKSAGAITFLPSPSASDGYAPKYIATSLYFPVFFITKKPLSEPVQKIFDFYNAKATAKK